MNGTAINITIQTKVIINHLEALQTSKLLLTPFEHISMDTLHCHVNGKTSLNTLYMKLKMLDSDAETSNTKCDINELQEFH